MKPIKDITQLMISDLKQGQLIFQQIAPDDDGIIRAIQESGGLINHVGLIGKEGVIEASMEKGVVVTSIEDFIQKADQSWVYRFNKSDLINDICAYAQKQLGQPYNHLFLSENPGYYCSELIVEACNFVCSGYFKPSILNFYLPNSCCLNPFWEQYYAQYNLKPPQGSIGSHPSPLIKQKQAISLVGFLPKT